MAEYRSYFYKQISDCLNWCIRLANTMKKEDADRLVSCIYNKREIFRHMLRSHRLTHKIEGRLLLLFPKRMRFIYNCLDIIHR